MKLTHAVLLSLLVVGPASAQVSSPPTISQRIQTAEDDGRLELFPMIDTYDRQGKLWARLFKPNPRIYPGPYPAVAMFHGGGGVNQGTMARARWYRDQGFVVVVVDSFGSRGVEQNWITYTQYGANMRAQDAVASVRYLRSLSDVDHKRIYITGGSQGGWAVLRTLTAGAPWSEEARQTIAAGIAMWPVCRRDKPGAVPLGPFIRPVLFLQGSADTATPPSFCEDLARQPGNKNAVYEGATHSFDIVAPQRQHPYWKYLMEYDALATAKSRTEIIEWTRTHQLR